MTRLGAACALAFTLLATALPASARSFIQDGAGLFSATTVSSLESRLSSFNAQTGKEVVVVTVPSLGATPLTTAAQQAFSQQNVNGVLIFIAKDDRKDIILPGRDTAQFFPAQTTRTIRQSMEAQFRTEDFDGGITSAVDGTLNVFRAHLSSAPGSAATTNRGYAPTSYARNTGVHISMFWWIIIFLIGFFVIRSIFRSMAGPRYYGGGPMAGGPGYGPGPGYGGPGYGGPGYGGGYYGGGGGGFWSGMLGGLGGAWLGNELFGGNRGETIIEQQGGNNVQTYDQGGWANDAGQADMGNSSAGDWGGGGFGGDSGGGFGGGDSGGGW